MPVGRLGFREEMATVLVVDDEPDIARAYAKWLEDDHEVEVATSGSEALDSMDDSVDVVLLDRRMPEMSGDDVLAELDDLDVSPRVVMVTAVEPDFEMVALPFDSYLMKPVSGAELKSAVEAGEKKGEYKEPEGDSSWPAGGPG